VRRHFLSTANLTPRDITSLLDAAQSFRIPGKTAFHKTDKHRQRTLATLFFEDSTRTRLSFETAAHNLGCHTLDLHVMRSSMQKGETVLDTARAIQAMGVDAIAVRHQESGMAAFLAEQVECAVVNAGDGTNEHPTQALLDALTIRQHKGGFDGLRIAICGDIKHSRVARSNIHLLTTMGAKVVATGPTSLLPADAIVPLVDEMEDAVRDADVVMMLRIQKERMTSAEIPSPEDYFRRYGLTYERLKLAKPNVIVMHPGPMNRGIEIDGALADDSRYSVIQEQITNGVAARMAVLDWIWGG